MPAILATPKPEAVAKFSDLIKDYTASHCYQLVIAFLSRREFLQNYAFAISQNCEIQISNGTGLSGFNRIFANRGKRKKEIVEKGCGTSL